MPTITRPCAQCGAEFTRCISPASLEMGRGKFCSKTCVDTNLKSHGHGRPGQQSPTYQSWSHMKHRCYNPNSNRYSRYGGRGITVCEEWRNSFETFLADMGEKPDGKTLDRINNDLGYSKENCRWATAKEQTHNRHTNVIVEYDGEMMPCTEAARRAGLEPMTVLCRIKYGWPRDRWFIPSQRA